MRLPFAAAALTTLSGVLICHAGPLSAAEGDLWSIDRENVNVRSGPSTSTDILMTINAGERMVEIASKGEWLFVEFPERSKRGWVFGPLMTKADTSVAAADAAAVAPATSPLPADGPAESAATPEAPKIENAVAETQVADPGVTVEPDIANQTAAVSTDQEPPAVKTFRETVTELNSRAVSVAGISLFDDVQSTGGGGVQVLATESWATVPEAGRESYMNALFDRWQSVANGLGPLSLQIVNPSGEVMMERSGS